MEAGRRQPGMLQGLSRFLVQHERCGAGFDVAHPAGLGSGRVSITCRGCGARHEYATATIEIERELTIEPAEPARQTPAPTHRQPPPIPPRPAPYPDSTRRHSPEQAPDEGRAAPSRRRRGAARQPAGVIGGRDPGDMAASGAEDSGRAAAAPREPGVVRKALRDLGRSPRATLILVVVAAVALGFAAVRLVNEGDGGSEDVVTEAPAPPSNTSPGAAPSGPANGPQASAPGTGTPPAPARPPTTTLHTERFTIEVPRGWTKEAAGGGLLLQPSGGGRVNVQIYYQLSPELSRTEMARETARFMTREVPGASLFPGSIELGGRPAYELTARGPGETAIAVDVLRGPYRYLLVRRIFAGAKPRVSQAAGRVVLSFRPR